ncbi:MAG: helix-turn-helix transcriptional regulator [Clostridiales bacterium]|nr:helix-turn-helix transcriptional regulator [Clostridiales bacterium]
MNRSDWFFRHNTHFLRKKKGLTQEKLAEMANVSVNEVSKVERGLVIPRLNVLDSFANAFGVSAGVLLDPHLDQRAEVPCTGGYIELVTLEMDGLPEEEQEMIYRLVRVAAQYVHDAGRDGKPPDKWIIK